MTERATQEAKFLILTALAGGSEHGYRVIAELQQTSGGRVRPRQDSVRGSGPAPVAQS
jgi:hypothetical protein